MCSVLDMYYLTYCLQLPYELGIIIIPIHLDTD